MVMVKIIAKTGHPAPVSGQYRASGSKKEITLSSYIQQYLSNLQSYGETGQISMFQQTIPSEEK
jgi:hypothetical protein